MSKKVGVQEFVDYLNESAVNHLIKVVYTDSDCLERFVECGKLKRVDVLPGELGMGVDLHFDTTEFISTLGLDPCVSLGCAESFMIYVDDDYILGCCGSLWTQEVQLYPEYVSMEELIEEHMAMQEDSTAIVFQDSNRESLGGSFEALNESFQDLVGYWACVISTNCNGDTYDTKSLKVTRYSIAEKSLTGVGFNGKEATVKLGGMEFAIVRSTNFMIVGYTEEDGYWGAEATEVNV